MAQQDIPQVLRDYIDSANIALSLSAVDEPDMPLLHVNAPFATLTGYPVRAVIGRNCRFLQRDYREQEARIAIRAFLDDPRLTHLRCTLVNFRADGQPFVNLLSMSKLKDLGHRLRFIFASQFDISRARPDQLTRYDASLADAMPLPGPVARDAGLILSGSLAAIADAAATIAQAKLTIEDVDRTARLF